MLGSHRKRRRRRRRERCVHERRERRSADAAWRQPSWWSVVEVDVPFVRRRVRLACFRQKGFARIAWSLPGDTGNARGAAAQGHGWRCSRGRRTPRRDRGGSRPRVRREGRNVHALCVCLVLVQTFGQAETGQPGSSGEAMPKPPPHDVVRPEGTEGRAELLLAGHDAGGRLPRRRASTTSDLRFDRRAPAAGPPPSTCHFHSSQSPDSAQSAAAASSTVRYRGPRASSPT